MAAITIQGKRQSYLFSVVPADFTALPEWGGIYLGVNADSMGMHIRDCYLIGSCESFCEYKDKIKALLTEKCTHVYLLPEYDSNQRKIALEDLLQIETFGAELLNSLEYFNDLHVPEKEEEVASA